MAPTLIHASAPADMGCPIRLEVYRKKNFKKDQRIFSQKYFSTSIFNSFFFIIFFIQAPT